MFECLDFVDIRERLINVFIPPTLTMDEKVDLFVNCVDKCALKNFRNFIVKSEKLRSAQTNNNARQVAQVP